MTRKGTESSLGEFAVLSTPLPTQRGLSLRTKVETAIREAIIHRSLPPGVHLVEEDLAATLDVSRNPVREAFRSLEREGWLIAFPGSGVFVAEPTQQEVVDLLEVRAALESLAALLAAERATRADIARLTDIVEKVPPSSSPHVSDAKGSSVIVDLNSEFHLAIARTSGNQELMRLIPSLSDRVRWLFAAVAAKRRTESWKEHRQLLRYISSGNVDAARELALRHVQRTREAYLAARES